MALRCIDLMIGDWVMLYDRPRKVEIIYDNGRVQVGCIEEDCDELEPIPLTPEILEKNGWIPDNSNDHLRIYNLRYGKGYSTIAISDDGKLSIEVSAEIAKKDKRGRADLVTFARDWCNGFCVHELQHALKLCGIDKEIVI